jgi:hypothetical protein
MAGDGTSRTEMKAFFKALLAGHENMDSFVQDTELQKANRLGISYENVQHKFLISYDIDPEVKKKVNEGNLKYEIEYQELGKGLTKATFSLKSVSYKREFFFKNGRLISPSSYYTQGWKSFSTKYFNFFISDTSLFNNYSAEKLDSYVEAMGNLLNLTKDDMQLLEKNKIIYILCKDQAEIEKLTGFNTRGMYTLAFDEVTTTFNCHFHELSHLLINFRLRKLPLYTLPFLQEGFASATGGRGGLTRSIILDAGYYMQSSGYIPYNSILTKKDFTSEDASMTYPVAALYNYFLLKELGIEAYLELYRNMSGSSGFVDSLTTASIRLPWQVRFEEFLKTYRYLSGVSLEKKGTAGRLIYEGASGKIYDYGNFYFFRIKNNIALSGTDEAASYKSKKFQEIFPNISYKGEKYLITSNAREVSVYNLYTNNLIASYSTGFSLNSQMVPLQDGYYEFYINKDIFDEDLQLLQASGI